MNRFTPYAAVVLRLAARLAFESGDSDAARRYLGRSIAIEPDNEETRHIEGMLR